MAKYLKKGNDVLRKDTTTGLISIITLVDIVGLDGTTTGVKNINTYPPDYQIPTGFEPATEAEWDTMAMKTIRYIGTLG